MANVWIYQKNKQSYINLMNDECGGPVIHKETEDKLQVDFCGPAMTVWRQAGFWFSLNENDNGPIAQ